MRILELRAVRRSPGARCRRDRTRRALPNVEPLEPRALLSLATLHAAAGPTLPAPPVTLTVTASQNTVDLLQPVTFTLQINTAPFAFKDVTNAIEEKNYFGNWVVVGSGTGTTFTVTQRLGGDVQFRVDARLIIDNDPARDLGGEVETVAGDEDDAVVDATSAPITEKVRYPSCQTIMADQTVSTVANIAWAAELSLTFALQLVPNANGTRGRRAEIGYWIQLDTATGNYRHTGLTLGAFNSPDMGAGVILGARPADVPAADGLSAVYTVASFHTHTPTTYRTGRFFRPTGPSGGDDNADKADNVAGLVYDYVPTVRLRDGTPAIPFGHPLLAAAKIYCSTKPGTGMPNRRM